MTKWVAGVVYGRTDAPLGDLKTRRTHGSPTALQRGRRAGPTYMMDNTTYPYERTADGSAEGL